MTKLTGPAELASLILIAVLVARASWRRPRS